MLSTPLVATGGAERQFFEEVKGLRELGHDVRPVTFALSDAALFVDGIGRGDVTVLRAPAGPGGKVVALRRALREMRPDLLVSHTSPELTWLATRGAGVPYVQYHNSPPFYIGPQANPYMASWRYRRAFPRLRDDVDGYAELAGAHTMPAGERALAEVRGELKHRSLRSARAIVTPSRRTARELRLLHGVEATVVRGCLDDAAIAAGRATVAERAAIVLSVCRLERVKRVDLLVRAFALVLREAPEARLIVAGGGPEREPLEELVRETGIGRAVRFAGYVPERELRALYASARTFAAPAMADFNIAPYEALAAGCNAVWTTEMETEPEIERSGRVFVARPQTEAFARAIVAALRAPVAAPTPLEHMTWRARAQRLDAIYRGIAEGVAA